MPKMRRVALAACLAMVSCGAPGERRENAYPPARSSAALATPGADAGTAPGAATAMRVVDLGLGWQHSCALLSDTTVRCWGRGDQGQVGDGTGEDRSRPTAVLAREGVIHGQVKPGEPILTGAAQLAVGQDHSCARMQDGRVVCWGSNSAGQAGSGPPYLAWSPRAVPALAGAVDVASGNYHVCALLKDGKVRCWGANHSGKPAQRNRGRTSTHEEIGGLDKVAKLAVGGSSACAVLADGGIACWPASDFGNGPPKTATRVPEISGAVDAMVDEQGGCAVLAGGAAACWGRHKTGTLKDVARLSGARGAFCTQHRDGKTECAGGYRAKLSGVIRAVPGGTHACAIVEPGKVQCWGSTEYGQVGNGAGRVRPHATPVKGISNAVGIAIGAASCALLATGEVVCWGSNSDYLLGKASPPHYAPAPVPFAELRGAKQVSIGGNLGVALRADGSVVQWNKDSEGVPKPVPGIRGAIDVAATGARACARLKDASMWCWGYEGFGELGRGVLPKDGESREYPPARVAGLGKTKAMALGDSHTCAVLEDGSVRCWGMADYGRLGNGLVKPYTMIPGPTRVKGLSDVEQLSTPRSGGFTCALLRDASLSCWGYDSTGAFGTWDEEKEQEAVPVPVAAKGIQGVLQIATTSSTTCARFAGGIVKCWGGNSYGAVGDGTTAFRARPTQVVGLASVVELGGGDDCFCARRADGSVWCWGRGDFGSIGDGSLNQIEAPVDISM